MSVPASRQTATTARVVPSPLTMGKYSCTMPFGFARLPAASVGVPASRRTAVERASSAAVIPLGMPAPVPTRSLSSLTSTRPSTSRISSRAIESSRSVRTPSSPDSSTERSSPMRSASRSLSRRLPLTKYSTSEASRSTTPTTVAARKCSEVTVTRAPAVTPRSARVTPKTRASSIGPRACWPGRRASNMEEP